MVTSILRAGYITLVFVFESRQQAIDEQTCSGRVKTSSRDDNCIPSSGGGEMCLRESRGALKYNNKNAIVLLIICIWQGIWYIN